MSVTGGIMAGVGAAGSLISGHTQAEGANKAEQIAQQNQNKALNFQNEEWDKQQQNQQPFLDAGQGAVLNLSQLLSKPGSGLLSPYGQTFKAPTLEEAENAPGYQFQRDQGLQALQNSAAARGELLDPNTQRALIGYGEGAAQSDYNNVYSQALQTFGTNYDVWHQGQQDAYGRLMGLTGVGQTSAGQLGQEGGNAALNTANILGTGAKQQGDAAQAAASATASGYAGATNSIVNGLSNYQQYKGMQDMGVI